MSAADAGAARPAASACSATSATFPAGERGRAGGARPYRAPGPAFGSPASCARRATSPSSPLLPPHATIADVAAARRRAAARSATSVIMFVDMRGSSALAEAAPALRHGVHDQPVPQRGEQRRDRRRGRAQPGPWRRASRAVRPQGPAEAACRQAIAACAAIAANVER